MRGGYIMKRSSVVILSLIVALLVLVPLVACAKPAPSPAPAPASPKPSPTPTPTPAPAPAAKAVTLKWAFYVPETDTRTKGLQNYSDLVNQRSGGRLILKIFAGESLVKASQEFDTAKAGNIDMLALTVSYEIGKVPILEDTILPFYATHDKLDTLFTKLGPIHSKYLAQNNLKYLYGVTHGYMQVFHRNKFLKTAADWQGQKMRLGGGYQNRFAQSMGAGIVTVTSPEQYMALQTGTVDGTVTSVSSYLSFKLNEVAPYVTACNWQGCGILISINMNVWNSLPADLQKIMLDAAPEGQKNYINLVAEFDRKSNDDMTKAGAKLYTLTSEERAAFIKQASPLYDDFASKGTDNKAIVDMIRELQK